VTTGRRAVFDTNVLFPPTLRDTLLYAADAGVFEPLWSAETLVELRRNLVLKAGMAGSRADVRIRHMTLAFPNATVHGHVDSAPTLPDPNDRHVVAATLAAGAELIVSSNVRHFPAPALRPFGIAVATPDEFLCGLLRQDEEAILASIRFHANLLRHPPTTVAGLLRSLAVHAPRFARLVLESGLLDE
jgi:predicted nucleic acid-binding protein